jgi:hypothetical protein
MKRAELEAAIDDLRASKPSLAPEQYDLQLEKLLLSCPARASDSRQDE